MHIVVTFVYSLLRVHTLPRLSTRSSSHATCRERKCSTVRAREKSVTAGHCLL